MIESDLDGVFANFGDAACQIHGYPTGPERWNFYEDWGMSETEFWGRIHSAGDAFYGRWVKPYSWCPELLGIMRAYDEVRLISTAAGGDPTEFSGKKLWCNKHLPGVPLSVVDRKYDKAALAKPDRVLIDDYDANCEKFIAAGGHAIVFPQLWNSQADHCGDRLDYVRIQLEQVFTKIKGAICDLPKTTSAKSSKPAVAKS